MTQNLFLNNALPVYTKRSLFEKTSAINKRIIGVHKNKCITQKHTYTPSLCGNGAIEDIYFKKLS